MYILYSEKQTYLVVHDSTSNIVSIDVNCHKKEEQEWWCSRRKIKYVCIVTVVRQLGSKLHDFEYVVQLDNQLEANEIMFNFARDYFSESEVCSEASSAADEADDADKESEIDNDEQEDEKESEADDDESESESEADDEEETEDEAS